MQIDGVLVGVRQTPEDTLVCALTKCVFDLVARMRDYFQLDQPLGPLYAVWAAGHARMKVGGRNRCTV